jgi:hypothetical protein
MEIKSSKDYHQTAKGKGGICNAHTHRRHPKVVWLVTEQVEMLQTVLYLVMRKGSKMAGYLEEKCIHTFKYIEKRKKGPEDFIY